MLNLHKPGLNLATPTQVKNFLTERGLSPRKFLGQHFLVDKNILKKIIQSARINKDEKILEIGAGIGTLTLALAETGASITAIEKDRGAVSLLKELVSAYPNVKVIDGDVLKIDLKSILEEAPVWKIVSNPPYSIVSPLLFKLVSFKEKFSSIVLMLQREFAKRLTARPGTKDYSFLSIKMQFHMDIEIIHKVSRRVFFPVPKVDSTILVLTPRKNVKVKVSDEDLFFKIADSMFRMRRKNLKNSLKPLNLPASFFESSPIDLTRRGETLSIEELGVLADFILKIKERLI